jgi:hypothetical protein
MIWTCLTQKAQDSSSVIADNLKTGEVRAQEVVAIQVVLELARTSRTFD